MSGSKSPRLRNLDVDYKLRSIQQYVYVENTLAVSFLKYNRE